MQNPKRILFTGGGSGGHIIPNLAIARELQKLGNVQLLYLGSRQVMDRALVTAAGIPFKGIFSGKLRRYFSWANFVDPFLSLLGFFQAFYHLIHFWPHAVFSKGGYVGLPVALAAWILRRPLVLHESDAVMGLANRITARLATNVCLGFSGAMPASTKTIFTGNPVRPEILNGSRKQGYLLTGFKPDRPVLLIWGGSQGAQEINDLVVAHFETLKFYFQIVHVTGRGKGTGIHDPAYKPFEYLGDELPHVYAITNFVLGRGGANSLAELAAVGKPNMIFPLKSAAHHHQERNAEVFEKEGASIILKDPAVLVPTLTGLLHNPTRQTAMCEKLQKFATPQVAQRIAQVIMQL